MGLGEAPIIEKTIEAWQAYEYLELWKVTAYKNGAVYRTERTMLHIRDGAQLPLDYVSVAINCRPGDIIHLKIWTP